MAYTSVNCVYTNNGMRGVEENVFGDCDNYVTSMMYSMLCLCTLRIHDLEIIINLGTGECSF